MADRYWVGGTDDWSSTAGTKWATTSGGAGGASVPTNADDVFFDAASGAITVTILGTATCRNLNFTGFTGSMGSFNGTVPVLVVTGNLTLSATMGNFGDGFGACRIVPPNIAVTITTNGKQSSWNGFITANARGLTFDNSGAGSSASITLLDDLKVQRAYLTGRVSLNLNNFSLDLISGSTGLIINCGSIGPTLNFGATGKIIVRTGGSVQVGFFASSGFSNVTFTGSKLVSVDILSATTLIQSSGTVPTYGTAAQALNYVSTAANQGSFYFYTAEDIDWSLGTGAIRADRASNFIYGNWNSGTKNISKTPIAANACAVNFAASSGTKTISGTGTWSGISIVVQPQAAGVTYNLGTGITQNAGNQRSTFTWAPLGGVASTFNTNNYPIITGGFEASGGTCNLGLTGIFSYGTNFGSPTPYLVSFGPGVNASSATIYAANASSRLLASNMTIGTLDILTSLTVTIPPTSSNLTFNNITNNTGATNTQIDFPSGVTTTVNNFNYGGQATPSLNVVRIRSTTPGTRAILSKASGTVNASYVDIQDSEATGGATWTALASNGNIDSGNNIGWDFGTTVVNVTGVAATGQVGTVLVAFGNVAVNVTGVSATGEVGIVTVPTLVEVVGVQATGEVGIVTVFTSTDANVNLIGVQATGEVGILFFYQWSIIIDTQDPGWVPVNDLQTPTWATINPNTSPVWTDVVI
jgi:hypothetical protein